LRLLLRHACLQLLLKLSQALLVQLLCLQLGFLLFYEGKAAFLVCPALAHLVAAPARLQVDNDRCSSHSGSSSKRVNCYMKHGMLSCALE
jgi:hypothetical protein